MSFARQIGPLGRALIADSRYEIVGIAADVKNASLQNATESAIFYPQRQFPFRSMHVFLRGIGSPDALMGIVRSTVRRIDSGLPLSRVTTLERLVGETIDRPRMLTAVMSVFAVLALTLSALGIYGVLSYSVSQRRQELSVRMALGAEPGAIVWLVVRQGLVLAAVGLMIGAAGSYALGRLLSGLLFGVTPTDLADVRSCPHDGRVRRPRRLLAAGAARGVNRSARRPPRRIAVARGLKGPRYTQAAT